MNIEKFNNEGMVFKTRVNFGASKDTIYLSERELAKIVGDEWDNPFIAYTDHINTYIRKLDDIEEIDILSTSTLTETEYEIMLDGLYERTRNQREYVNVITDEEAISDSVKLSLERCSK